MPMPRILRKPLSLAAVAAAAAAALALFGPSGFLLTHQVEAAFAGSHPAAGISTGGAASGTRRTRLARPGQLGVVSPSSPTAQASLSSKIRLPEVSAGGVGNDDDDDDDDDDDTDEDCLFPLDMGQLQSPALVRGNPLEESDKSRNRELVRAIKTFLFDTLFGGPQGSGGGGTDTATSSAASSAVATTPPALTMLQQAGDDDLGDVIRMSYRRFYALETIARTPYFAYVSALHLLETVGQWRQADYLKLHFCEAWNELHHLLILEELLGGSIPWRDRFVAQHVAVGYYWFAVAVYMVNPALAYNLNQAVEEEAYETYQGFLGRHGPYLQSQSAPDVAKTYYAGEDLYLFDSMHHRGGGAAANGAAAAATVPRRPKCETLYDTFTNIRDDEMEHVKTMAYLQGECQRDEGISVPNTSEKVPTIL
jgi:ubiquinol oxidase